MAHSEPKVTIDLKEYNELQEYKKRFQKLKVADYNKAFNILLTHGVVNTNMSIQVRQALQAENLIISVTQTDADSTFFIDKIKP